MTCDPVPIDDRAFLYGDGLFETLLAIDGQLLWTDLHLQRLALGAGRLHIDYNREEVANELRARAASLQGPASLRLTLSRGSGPRGYRPEAAQASRTRISSSSLAMDPLQTQPPLVLKQSTITLGDQPLLGGLKHCNRLEQVLAAAEADREGVDDVLLFNSLGNVQCTGRGNVFVLRDRDLLTPPCVRCGIAGTRRRLVMETLAPMVGLTVTESELTLEAVYTSEACFVTNAIMGIRAVGRIDEVTMPHSNEAILSLQEAYRHEARACLRA